MFPVCMWNVCALEGPRTNNHAEGWHLKVQNLKLAGKAHPNLYEAVTSFQSEQAATEVNIMQLAAGGLIFFVQLFFVLFVTSVMLL